MSRQVRGTFTGVADAGEGVDRLPTDLRGGCSCGGRDEDAAADALRRSNSFLEREGLARALCVSLFVWSRAPFWRSRPSLALAPRLAATYIARISGKACGGALNSERDAGLELRTR